MYIYYGVFLRVDKKMELEAVAQKQLPFLFLLYSANFSANFSATHFGTKSAVSLL